MKLNGEYVQLRAVEKEDATRLLLWENNPDHWKVSGTEVPFSMHAILEYIDQAQHLRTHGQLRLMICDVKTGEPVGTIDLYNADFKHLRAAVGILIGSHEFRRKGYALEALLLVEHYASHILGLHNLYCSVQGDNEASKSLFEKAGYHLAGIRKDWFMQRNGWLDELLFQKCLKKE